MQLPPQQRQCPTLSARFLRWFDGPQLKIAFLVAFCAASPAFCQISLPKETTRPHANDEAASILRQMAEAYSRLPSLQMHSVYTATLLSTTPEISKATLVGGGDDGSKSAVPTKPNATAAPSKSSEADVADDSPNRRVDRTVDLLYVQPNLLKITDSRTNATKPSEISTWVSDGKIYSAFVPKSHNSDALLYTQEKAPHTIRGFARLQNLDAGSLELVMLMGINPFQNLTPNLAAVRVDDPATVRGVETNVVTIISVNRSERDILHFYIGMEDHLLHRFISEVSPVETENKGARKIGDALDEDADESRPDNPSSVGSDSDHPLEAGDARLSQRTEAKRTRIVYDNVMTTVSHVEHGDFTFSAPTGASIFFPVGTKQVIDPNSKRLVDMIRKSAQGHTKPVHDVTDVHEVSP